MLEIFEIYTVVITTLWIVLKFRTLYQSSQFTIGILLYIFYIIPLLLDYSYQFVDYSNEGWGFRVSSNDIWCRILYDITIMYTIYRVLYKPPKHLYPVYNQIDNRNIKQYRAYLLLGSLIPPIAVILLLRQPGMLFLFQWRELGIFPTTGSYSTIEKFTYIAVSCSVFLLLDRNTKLVNIYRLLSLPLLAVNICIQGKRAIIFFMVINVCIICYFRVKDIIFKSKHSLLNVLFVISICLGGLVFMLNMTYQVKSERGYNVNDDSAMYTSTRIDFFRDDRVRLAIYKKLYPDETPMLDYPGQTILTDMLSFVPLNYVTSAVGAERYNYQTYLTCALENHKRGNKINVSQYGYMTVCFIAELISNFGILAIFIIPYVCLWFCKKIDQYPYPYNALITCAFVLLNLFDFTYIVYYLELLFVLCCLYKFKHNKYKPLISGKQRYNTT